MKILHTIALFLVTFQLHCQTAIKPFVQLTYYQSYLNDIFLDELELGGGIQFNDYFSTQVNFRGAQEAFFSQEPSINFRFATISIEPSYRFLGKKHIFSPVIAYNAGIEIANNGKDKFIKMSNYSYKPYYHSPYVQYDKGLYFGKAKVLLSIQRKGVNFLIGATYNTYFFQFHNLIPQGTQSIVAIDNKYKNMGLLRDWQFGFGFETSIKYTFPMKKRATKTASGGE